MTKTRATRRIHVSAIFTRIPTATCQKSCTVRKGVINEQTWAKLNCPSANTDCGTKMPAPKTNGSNWPAHRGAGLTRMVSPQGVASFSAKRETLPTSVWLGIDR